MGKKKLIIIISSIVIVVSALVATLLITNNVKYTVTFNSDGGTTIEKQIVKKGDKVSEPKEPTKKGYKFISWTYQDKTYNFSSEVISNIELKAKWYKETEEIKEYTVRFQTNGGTTIENQIVEEGKTAVKPEEPKKEGYEFKGWYLNDKEYDFEAEVTEDIELEAKWEKVKEINNNTNTKNNTTNNSSSNNNVSSSTKEENIKVETPTLSNPTGHAAGVLISAKLTINYEGEYSLSTSEGSYNLTTISGWEVYEKVGDKYNLVDTTANANSIEVTVDIGETKTFVARVYKLNKNKEKVYSAYSNEFKIDNSKVETPTLSNPTGHAAGVLISAKLTINYEGEYSLSTSEGSYNLTTISGWEVYEKVGDKYNLVDTTANANSIEVTVDIGETKTFVARVYKLNKNKEKVYSAYSNEFKIDNNLN